MLGRTILRNPEAPGWLRFSDPVDSVYCHDTAGVADALIEVERRVNEEGLFAAGFVSYEAAPGFDAAFRTRAQGALPLVCFGLYAGVESLDELPAGDTRGMTAIDWQMTTPRDTYLDDLAEIRRQIEAGNTYQINYTVRQRAAGIDSPWQLFLTMATDAPYAAYLECDRHTLVSASPELFFRLDGRTLTCKPMKGTAPRGMTTPQDRALRDALQSSAKNRAENVMIADMVRNDMGRIADPGTVRAAGICDIEKYATVWQMTSTISARTDAAVADIFRALFPSASITGAPKVSSMSIIAGLEQSPRDIYTGAIGYISPGRKAHFSVAIRTVLLDTREKNGTYGVGGGIVWDSEPEDEYRECLAKAKILSREPQGHFQLLETMRWEPGSGIHLHNEHLARLAASAEYFDFRIDPRRLQDDIERYTDRLPQGDCRIRLLLDRDGQATLAHERLPTSNGKQPVSLVLARDPIDRDDPFLYHKTTHRAVYEQALAGVPEGADALLWNADGFITESSIANFIVIFNGRRYTPPVSSGLLAGTLRNHLLDRGDIEERAIHLSELRRAQGIRLINSVRGEYPAVWSGRAETGSDWRAAARQA